MGRTAKVASLLDCESSDKVVQCVREGGKRSKDKIKWARVLATI